MLLQHSDALLPWKQFKMAAKQLFKSSNLQSHSMRIKKITVSTNIKLSSFLRSILWLLCFSFTLLYYLHFMLVKMIPIIFQIGIKLKQISPATSLLVEVTTSQYTNTP